VPVAQLSRFWQDPADRLPNAVGLTQAGHRFPHCSQIMSTATTAAAAIAMGEVDALAGRLATADADLAAAKKESARLRGLIATRMETAGVKTYKTAWGSMTLADANSYTYSHNVITLQIRLEGEREIERETGIAKVETKKSLKVTYSK